MGAPEFTDEERDRALTALALSGGNAVRAAALLEQDTKLSRTPSRRRLQEWKHLHAERYAEIRQQRAPQIEAAAVQDYLDLVVEGVKAQHAAVARFNEGIDELSAAEAATAYKNIAVGTGVAADKHLLYTNRPTQITEHHTADQLIRELQRELNLAIPSTAEEITDVALPRRTASTNTREG